MDTTVSAIPVEYASQRKIRTRNKLYYRFNHWPIWIFVSVSGVAIYWMLYRL